MSEETKADLDTQRQVVRELMDFEWRVARLRREMTKPIDYTHRLNQSMNVLQEELNNVKATFEDALRYTQRFIDAARRRTGMAAYGRFKSVNGSTSAAIKEADRLFDEAHAETTATNPTNETTDNKEQA